MRARLLFLLVLAILAAAPRAWAADASTVLLLVHGDELPAEKLRDRIARELGRPVALSGANAAGGVVTVPLAPGSEGR